jgi:F0F1-type ATP synthase delta subunit
VKVPRHLLTEAIAKQTLEVTDSKQLAREIAAYLLIERRTAELESIMRDIMQYRQDHGALEADVISAHDVSNAALADVKHLLQEAYPHAKTITLTHRLDSSVIGGLKVDLPNEQLDMTIRAKLSKFKTLTGAGGNV